MPRCRLPQLIVVTCTCGTSCCRHELSCQRSWNTKTTMSSCMPFIMPDGRRLTQLLDHGESDKARSHTKKGKKSDQRRTVNLNLEPQNEYEAQEFAAAAKLGARSRLRWANDRLLRQLAGAMQLPCSCSHFARCRQLSIDLVHIVSPVSALCPEHSRHVHSEPVSSPCTQQPYLSTRA